MGLLPVDLKHGSCGATQIDFAARVGDSIFFFPFAQLVESRPLRGSEVGDNGAE